MFTQCSLSRNSYDSKLHFLVRSRLLLSFILLFFFVFDLLLRSCQALVPVIYHYIQETSSKADGEFVCEHQGFPVWTMHLQ